ncbi:MAG: CotH kinase family protein, partial [Myxococcaceae bacterium]|nr:CotH kinase family protein [Myxococcaceae bacterium]
PAEFIHQGVRQPVLVRLRGNSSRDWPKKSWRVEFPDGVRFEGRQKVNLLSEWIDSSLMAEKLGYDLLAAMQVPVPRAKYVRLVINGVYQGVYLDLERVDKRFAAARPFPDTDPTIYRCGGKDCEMKTWRAPYQGAWQKKTNELEGNEDLEAFLHALNHTPEPSLEEALERQMELELYLRTMVMDALIANNVIEDSSSYLLHDRLMQRWLYVPWDLNNADARFFAKGGRVGDAPKVGHPLVGFSLIDPWVALKYHERLVQLPGRGWAPIFSNLNTRIVLHPRLRARLIALVERALDELYRPEVIGPRIDAMHALIAPHTVGDPHVVPERFAYGRVMIQEFVRQRADFVRAELERLRAPAPGLVLGAFDAAAGWVEVRNLGAAALSTQGLVLTTNLRSAMQTNVPSRLVQPGKAVRFNAAELGLTFPASGEVGLFDGRSETGMLDALYYGELSGGQRYIRSEAEPRQWEVR